MSVMENKPKPHLALFDGGKGSKNWLGKLPKGTTFLTREIASSHKFGLTMFQVVEKTDQAVLLLEPNYNPGMPQMYLWVDPIKFSINMDPFEIFNKEEQEDVSDETDECNTV